VPRYYIHYNYNEGKVQTTTRKPNTFPYIYVGEGYFTFAPSKGIQVRSRSIEELEYFLLAHQLQAVNEQRQEAFKALRERLEVMKIKAKVKQHG